LIHLSFQACISSNAAICAAADKIVAGHASVVIAGGCETFSDVPIRLTRPLRQKIITLPKAIKKGGPLGGLRHLLKLNIMKDVLALETPAIANYTTGEVMGVSSDKLSAKFGVSREDQDAFAVRSHNNAAKAHAEGYVVCIFVSQQLLNSLVGIVVACYSLLADELVCFCCLTNEGFMTEK